MFFLKRNLFELMKALKISEYELAKQTGVPQPLINKILHGQNNNPKVFTLKKLADYFHITISQLVGDDDLPKMDAKSKTKRTSWKEIPLLAWEQAIDYPKTIPDDIKACILTDAAISDHTFGIEMVGTTMEPLFPEKTVLIIDPLKKTYDRSYALVYLTKKDILTFKQILIDGKDHYLKALNPVFSESKIELLSKKDKIIGVLVQAKKNY